jgi:hypothetical protein
MTDYLKLSRSMTVTGFIIFILGMFTFTPEIFFSGILVMAVSAIQGTQQLETMRLAETTPVSNVVAPENTSYYAW